jgi:hypothetical protein
MMVRMDGTDGIDRDTERGRKEEEKMRGGHAGRQHKVI